MSHLQYSDYEGLGRRVRKDTHYSQAVRISNIIETSGQGGWDRLTEDIPNDSGQQVDQAFANVEETLKQAGGNGWDQVFKLHVYLAPMGDEIVGHLIRSLKKYCPNHQPLVTCVGVAELYQGMKIEIEVKALLES